VSSIHDTSPGNWSDGNFAVANGNLFFSADDGVHGSELWRSDGTPAGTLSITDINPGSTSSAPGALGNVAGTIIFAAMEPVHGRELWKQPDEFAPALWDWSVNASPQNTVSLRFNE